MTWNEFFDRRNDNKPAQVKKPEGRTYDDFEHDYRKMYGMWLDHHWLKLRMVYGVEIAERILQENIEALNREVDRKQQEEATRYDWKEVPEGVLVPF